MKTWLFSTSLFLSLLLAPLPQLTGGQAAVLQLSDFVNASSLIAVVEVTEVTKVDVTTSEHHHTSVFVAQATVLQVLKTDIWPAPAPKERRIAIVKVLIGRLTQHTACYGEPERAIFLATCDDIWS